MMIPDNIECEEAGMMADDAAGHITGLEGLVIDRLVEEEDERLRQEEEERLRQEAMEYLDHLRNLSNTENFNLGETAEQALDANDEWMGGYVADASYWSEEICYMDPDSCGEALGIVDAMVEYGEYILQIVEERNLAELIEAEVNALVTELDNLAADARDNFYSDIATSIEA